MVDIFETCDLINQYIEESKGNALDKLYGKEVDSIIKKEEILKAAINNGMPKSYIQKKEDSLNDEKNKLHNRLVKVQDIPGGSVDKYIKALTNRARNTTNPDTAENIKRLKFGLPKGQASSDDLRKVNNKSYNKYLNMQKDIDKINGIKRESTDARLNVYEAFDAGLITEFEKTELLNILDNTYEE